MNAIDSVKNTALAATGRTKEVIGFTFKNRDLQAEGQADQIQANLRRARDRGLGAVDALKKTVNL